jgi:uncharacterized protein
MAERPEHMPGLVPERDGYIHGVPCAVDTTQPDPEAAVAFYAGLFGWEFEDVMPPEAPMRYFVARLRGRDVAAVASAPEGVSNAAWRTYFWVDSADDAAATVRAAGGTVVADPVDVPPDAGRTAILRDPGGAEFSVWQARQNRGAQLVNAPGTLNLNGLHTHDVAGAKAFYGSVFGWGTLALGNGGPELWTLDGFGDFLERGNPDLRKQMAEAGAPARFEDVVASINPIPDDQPDAPVHWDVKFAVADADATAALAAELGGTVIVPPMDAPWVRVTVIADPQGATFVASKFAPENM